VSDPLSDAELEATLRDIGRHLVTPVTPNLAAGVRARLAGRREPRRPWMFALAPALLTVVVLVGGATAAELVRLRGVDVFRVPAVSAPPRQALDLGERVTLAIAGTLMQPQPLRTSGDPVFGTPDDVYARRQGNAQVSFVYAPRPGLPPGPTGHGALVTQLRGSLDRSLIGKGVGPGARVESVLVGDAPGIWIEGEAHFFFYRDSAGNILQETLRLAGNTLLWQRDGVLLRLEAQVDRQRALEIASSFR